jgi:hypothetical protein
VLPDDTVSATCIVKACEARRDADLSFLSDMKWVPALSGELTVILIPLRPKHELR